MNVCLPQTKYEFQHASSLSLFHIIFASPNIGMTSHVTIVSRTRTKNLPQGISPILLVTRYSCADKVNQIWCAARAHLKNPCKSQNHIWESRNTSDIKYSRISYTRPGIADPVLPSDAYLLRKFVHVWIVLFFKVSMLTIAYLQKLCAWLSNWSKKHIFVIPLWVWESLIIMIFYKWTNFFESNIFLWNTITDQF